MTQPAPDISPRPVTVAGVKWHSVLDFTRLFQGFRLAINPPKIILALLAIVLIYSAGRLFDLAWGPQVYPTEIASYQNLSAVDYRKAREKRLDGHVAAVSLAELLRDAAAADQKFPVEQIPELMNHPRAALRALEASYMRQFQTTLKNAADERASGERMKPDLQIVTPDSKSPVEMEQAERATAAKDLLDEVDHAKVVVGHGIFASLLDYEILQFDALVDNTLTFVRVVPVRSVRSPDLDADGAAVSGCLISRDPDRLWRSDTIVGCIVNMTITAPMWLASATAPMQWRPATNPDTWGGWLKTIAFRGLYLLSLFLLALFSLLVIALTGAIIARMSALELAGVERAPLKDAILFAVRRLWVFVKAPVTPFLILLVIGLGLTAVSLVGAIPYVGEIIIGAIFLLFIVGGFVLMLLLLGILGGFNLLYPTIAVEGTDAFDAMSRSFAYVYARPWRLIFYTVVSLIYGVITYLFVCFAVYLILLIAHAFVGWGTNLFGAVYGANSGLPKLDTLWPVPQFSRLVSPTNWYAMNWSEYIGSIFLHFWVYLLVCAIGAYVISYYFSTHTIIYLLLRRSVDGQATTEIFVDEPGAPTNAAPSPPAAPAPIPSPDPALASGVAPATPAPAGAEPPPSPPA